MLRRTKIAVLVSGGGTNLQALIDAQNAGILQSGEISLVISSNPEAYALERAAKHAIPSVVVSKRQCGGQEAFEARMIDVLTENGIELIVLAGFMTILSEAFTSRYPRRIINVWVIIVQKALITAACAVIRMVFPLFCSANSQTLL